MGQAESTQEDHHHHQQHGQDNVEKSTPVPLPYTNERLVALHSIEKAASMVNSFLSGSQKSETSETSPSSPSNSSVPTPPLPSKRVVAFSSLAIVVKSILNSYPEDVFLLPQHFHVALSDDEINEVLRIMKEKASIEMTLEEIAASLQKLKQERSETPHRFWVFNPLKSDESEEVLNSFSLSLALVESRESVLSVLCTKESIAPSQIYVATKDHGALYRDLGEHQKNFRPLCVSKDKHLKTVNAGSSSLTKKLSPLLQKTLSSSSTQDREEEEERSFRLVANGEVTALLLFPTPPQPVSIFDVAAGAILVKESGGEVTDGHGNSVNFTYSTSQQHLHGLVATNKVVHSKIIGALDLLLFPPEKNFVVTIEGRNVNQKELAEVLSRRLGLPVKQILVS